MPHPTWSNNSNIYIVNVRQYTDAGTFNSFKEHLLRLKDMGVDILWFMPITPISIKDRKGSLGSYYAVQNYTAVNPEFGSLQDFINLVTFAHTLGCKVIIDWVANHTGNDNVWIDTHPGFFCYDEAGQVVHPNGWEDVSKLNFDNRDMRDAMIAAMKFWIETCNIDGFRCDMAHLVPLDFWREAKKELQQYNAGLFWLAECEEPVYHEVFDATYTWKWMHETERYCKQPVGSNTLTDVLKEYDHTFPHDAFRVYFTSNHDENSWNGTEYEKYGDAAKAFAVFSCTWNGMPMIYSGQELPNHKRLLFFDKDCIDWHQHCDLHEFYKTLLELRKRNPALRAGDNNVSTNIFNVGNDNTIFAFSRTYGNDIVFVILNLSAHQNRVEIFDDMLNGTFINVFDKTPGNFSEKCVMLLEGWDFRVYEKQKTP